MLKPGAVILLVSKKDLKMTKNQWEAFCTYKNQLKKYCDENLKFSAELKKLQIDAVGAQSIDYEIETPVVYNTAYDELTEQDEIKLILIGDNPGKNEQLKKNCRYLVGQSGKIGDKFFTKNPELEIDFRKNVIIMNKTPVHTARTTQLKYLAKNGSDEIRRLIDDSQKLMAKMAVELHQTLIEERAENSKIPQLWLIGYSEMKNSGIFNSYKNDFKAGYRGEDFWNQVFVYQHFSMNRFTVDLNNYRTENPDFSLIESLENLGHIHRDEIFGTYPA